MCLYFFQRVHSLLSVGVSNFGGRKEKDEERRKKKKFFLTLRFFEHQSVRTPKVIKIIPIPKGGGRRLTHQT